MVIGVPKEIHRQENRVGLSPFAASQLTAEGHTVYVENGAGVTAHFIGSGLRGGRRQNRLCS